MWTLHPNVAWLEDGSGRIHAMNLPDGEIVVLDEVASVIFHDVAGHVDPLVQARERWPEEAEEAVIGVVDFLDQLHTMGIVTLGGVDHDGEPQP